jgi:hypothetical protein
MEKKNSKLAWIIGCDTPYHNVQAIDDVISDICQGVDYLISKNVTYAVLLIEIKRYYENITRIAGGVFGTFALSRGYLDDNNQVIGDILEMMFQYYGTSTLNMKILEGYIKDRDMREAEHEERLVEK